MTPQSTAAVAKAMTTAPPASAMTFPDPPAVGAAAGVPASRRDLLAPSACPPTRGEAGGVFLPRGEGAAGVVRIDESLSFFAQAGQ